jgi:MerR family transcriptional regulator/heat shock protein HspR
MMRPMPQPSRGPEGERRYVVHVAARLLGVHPRTLRYYEEIGLVERRGDAGRTYTEADLERLRMIRRLVDDLGVNLAGADVILHMRERILQLHAELEQLRRELDARRR